MGHHRDRRACLFGVFAVVKTHTHNLLRAGDQRREVHLRRINKNHLEGSVVQRVEGVKHCAHFLSTALLQQIIHVLRGRKVRVCSPLPAPPPMLRVVSTPKEISPLGSSSRLANLAPNEATPANRAASALMADRTNKC